MAKGSGGKTPSGNKNPNQMPMKGGKGGCKGPDCSGGKKKGK